MTPSTWIDSDKRQNVGVDVAAIVNHRALRSGGATHRLAIEEVQRDNRGSIGQETRTATRGMRRSSGGTAASTLPAVFGWPPPRPLHGSTISIRKVIELPR